MGQCSVKKNSAFDVQNKKTPSGNKSNLGRTKAKHIVCDYQGNEDDCPEESDKCAISIKADGDIALKQNNINLAIKQYKKAVFINPKFAEAWASLGKAYGVRLEYNNAISAFNKAIAIDSKYGDALFWKAIVLRNQGNLDEAIALTDEILEIYDDGEVEKFREELLAVGMEDVNKKYSIEEAIALQTSVAYELVEQHNLLNADGQIKTEHEIYCKESFAKSIYSHCKRQYNSLGNDKIWSESIISSFYGSLCTTLLFYADRSGFESVEPFSYLCNHVDIDELERNAEKLLNIRQNEEAKDNLWNLIYSFVKACREIVEKLEDELDVEATVIDASESAYVMGMLFAMRHNEKKIEKRESLDDALKKLADSTKDYNYIPPDRSAMCYSIVRPVMQSVYYTCDCCGKTETAYCEEQQKFDNVFEEYKQLAKKFTALGYSSKASRVCNDCANQQYPSHNKYHVNNLVFSLIRKDNGEVVNSYPSLTKFEEMPYKIALAFLNGADTFQKLSDSTDTKLPTDDYLRYIHFVLGNTISEIG